MTTEKQTEANQQNALVSTGPITETGKAISAQNAVKHGIFAASFVLLSGKVKENPEEFQLLKDDLIECLKPKDQLEYLIAEKIAVDFWRLRRLIGFETGTIESRFTSKFQEQYHLSDAVDRVTRYERSLHNAIIKNLIILKKWQNQE